MFIRLKRAICIFSNLVKLLELDETNAKAEKLVEGAWPLESFIFQWLFAVCIRNRFVLEKMSGNANLPFWSDCEGWVYWIFSNLSPDGLHHPSFSQEKGVYKQRNSSWAVSSSWITPIFPGPLVELIALTFYCVWRFLLDWEICEWYTSYPFTISKISGSSEIFSK